MFSEGAFREKVGGDIMPRIEVVVDACVLFPASLRDTLLRAAEAGFYRIRLSDTILEETRRNLVKKGMRELKAQRLVDKIKLYFPESLVVQYDELIPSMPINEKDRHVLACAIASRSPVVVTQNLKDFPPHLLDPFNIKALSPDDFLVNLFNLHTKRLIQILIDQAGDLRNPPQTVAQLLDTLNQHAPKFVDLVRRSLNGEDVEFWS